MTITVDSEDTATAARARFESYGDPAVAISLVTPAEGAEAVEAADGPLAGVPFAVKDNIDVAGAATTAGCPAFAYLPAGDAVVVRRLREAGAVPVAKSNLDQFATGLVGTRSPYGTPRNPLDATRIPGGSSSGSAVAVAAGLVPFALGTDTAGSGRVPAAFTGIVGLKPTRGLVSTRGIVPAVRSLDCPSVFARTVAGAWSVLAASRGFDPADEFSRELAPVALGPEPRVGVLRPAVLDALCDPPTAGAYRDAIAVLGGLGYTVEPVDVEPFLEAGRLLYEGPWVAERYAAVGAFLEAHRGDAGVDPVVAAIVLGARERTAVEAYEGSYRLAALDRATDTVWSHVDLLALPTTPMFPTLAEVSADPIGVNTRLGTFTTFVNLLDLCAVTLPGPPRADGLPAGLSLVGRAGTDAGVAGVAARFHGEAPLDTAATHAPTSHAPTSHAATSHEFGRVDVAFELAVVGAHLRGQPLNHQLTDLGATLLRSTRTAPDYRLYALAGATPPKPGLVRVDAGGGAIEVETWSLDADAFGRFVAAVPGPLCIGTVELADGSTCKGFLCEAHAVAGAQDITGFGGWRAYLSRGSGAGSAE